MISVAQLLTDIAGGFCPVSGKALPKSSSAQSSAAIRLLYSLAIEFVGDGEAVEVAPRPARKRVSGYTAKQVAELLTALAGGVNPSTGEILPDTSLANSPDAVRLLYSLAMEFQQAKSRQPKPKKQSRDLDELRESRCARRWKSWLQCTRVLKLELRQGGRFPSIIVAVEACAFALKVVFYTRHYIVCKNNECPASQSLQGTHSLTGLITQNLLYTSLCGLFLGANWRATAGRLTAPQGTPARYQRSQPGQHQKAG